MCALYLLCTVYVITHEIVPTNIHTMEQKKSKMSRWHEHFCLLTIPKHNASHFTGAKITVMQRCSWKGLINVSVTFINSLITYCTWYKSKYYLVFHLNRTSSSLVKCKLFVYKMKKKISANKRDSYHQWTSLFTQYKINNSKQIFPADAAKSTSHLCKCYSLNSRANFL